MTPRYHGELYQVRGADGRIYETPRVHIGSLPGIGLVAANSQADLLAGRLFSADSGRQFVGVTEVYYRRKRGPPYAGTHWKHAVEATEMGVSRYGLPVFRHIPGRGVVAAHACLFPPGDFICDG